MRRRFNFYFIRLDFYVNLKQYERNFNFIGFILSHVGSIFSHYFSDKVVLFDKKSSKENIPFVGLKESF